MPPAKAAGCLATARRRLDALLARASTLSGFSALLESRWYLLLRTLPKVAAALALRLLCAHALGMEWFSAETVNGFSQSAIFVLAILVSGVLEDYKESEGLPAALASEVEGLSEQVELCAVLAAAERARSSGSESGGGGGGGGGGGSGGIGAVDGRALHTENLHMVESIFSFLGGLSSDRDVLSAISSHSRFIAATLALGGFGDQAGEVMGHAQALRALITRMHVIKRTDFLESGTALMELLVYMTLGLAVTAKSDSVIEGYSNVAFTTLQFFYVIELLRDIDDPFEYDSACLRVFRGVPLSLLTNTQAPPYNPVRRGENAPHCDRWRGGHAWRGGIGGG